MRVKMSAVKEVVEFHSHGVNLEGSLVAPEQEPQGGVLFLHGGSRDTGHLIFEEWQGILAKEGYGSLAFSFKGVNGSGGKFEEGTLNDRVEDSEKALDFLLSSGKVDPKKIAVVGLSMSGHIAARLAERNPDKIAGLVLIAPAAYAKEAEDLPFVLGGEFTKVLHAEGSWKNSPAFVALKNFKKPKLLFYPYHEEIIPAGVQRLYRSLASTSIQLRKVGHLFFNQGNGEERQAIQELYTKTTEFLRDLND